MELHATVIDNILKNCYLHKPKWTKVFDVLAILVLGFLTDIVLPRLSAFKGMLFAAGLFVLHILTSFLLFKHSGLWINIIYPLLALALIYTSLTIYHYMTEECELKKIRGAFTYLCLQFCCQ
jgi:serine/threonine-protein kinase